MFLPEDIDRSKPLEHGVQMVLGVQTSVGANPIPLTGDISLISPFHTLPFHFNSGHTFKTGFVRTAIIIKPTITSVIQNVFLRIANLTLTNIAHWDLIKRVTRFRVRI